MTKVFTHKLSTKGMKPIGKVKRIWVDKKGHLNITYTLTRAAIKQFRKIKQLQ